jgi:hypothetical protein
MVFFMGNFMTCRSIIRGSSTLLAFVLAWASALTAQTRPLPYNPVTAEYSNALDRIIFISANPNQLHIFDPVNNSDSAVNLPKPPLSLSVSLDGMYAAVGHDALISYVNLQTAALEKTLASSSTVTSLVLGNDYVYILTYQSGTQWVQISTGATGSYGIYNGTAGRLHPSGTALYTSDNGLSVDQLEDLDVSTGPVTGANAGPYFGDYPVCGGVWFSPDGSRVYVGCAMAYQANPQDATLSANSSAPVLDTKADGLYWTPFAGTSQIRSLTESATLGRIAVIPPNQGSITPPVKDNQVLLYDSAYIEPAGVFQLPNFEINGKSYPAHGQQVFYNQASTALYVVVQAEPSSPLPNPFAVEIFPVGNPPACAPTFSAARSTLAASGTVATVGIKAPGTCIYQASSTVNWIQLVSGAYGSGDGTLTFVVRPNSGPERTGDIKLGGQTYAVTQTAAPAPSKTFERLGYSVVGAGYSKSLDKVITIVSNPKELHILDPISASDQVVPLPKPPVFLSISPDGLSAAVGLAGWVSIVNLSTATITSTVQVFTDVHTLVLGGNGYFYAYPQNAVGFLFSTQIATGSINLANGIYNGRYPQLYVDGTEFYTEDSKWSISQGPASLISEDPSGFFPPIWLTEDGSRMITSYGKAYTTSPVPALDLLYAGSFSNATYIQWAAEAVKWHSTAVIPSAVSGTDNNGDEFLQMYGDAFLGYAGDLSLPMFTVGSTAYAGHGRYVFWNKSEDNLIVLEQADSTAKLTADYGVAVYHLTTSKAGCSYALGADSGSFDNNGGLNTVSVSTGAECTWDAVPNVSWITVDSGAIGFGSNSVEYSVAANSGSMSRIGSLVVGGQPFLIVQGGSASSGKFINAVEPRSGSGSKQSFTVVYSDTAGAASLKSVSASFSVPHATTNACMLSYNVATNQISLQNDASTASTTATPGTAVTLQNSQCALNVAAVTVTASGNTLILTLPMTFESAYAGTKNIYLSATDVSGAKSGSQKQGAWTVP